MDIELKEISHDSKIWQGRIHHVYFDDTAAKWKGTVFLNATTIGGHFSGAVESATFEGLPAAAKAALTA